MPINLYCAASIKICINECGCPYLWETWLRNLNLVWHLAKEILYGPRHLNCGWKIYKSNKKKFEGKKAHAEDWTQTFSGLTEKFKFFSQVSHKHRNPHRLMQILIDVAQYIKNNLRNFHQNLRSKNFSKILIPTSVCYPSWTLEFSLRKLGNCIFLAFKNDFWKM